MEKIKFFLLFLAVATSQVFASSNTSGNVHEIDYSLLNCKENRVYVDSDQLIFANTGIFVLLNNVDGTLTKKFVPQVNADTEGLFVALEHIVTPQVDMLRCPKFHPISCVKCKKCSEKKCPYRCRCND